METEGWAGRKTDPNESPEGKTCSGSRIGPHRGVLEAGSWRIRLSYAHASETEME